MRLGAAKKCHQKWRLATFFPPLSRVLFCWLLFGWRVSKLQPPTAKSLYSFASLSKVNKSASKMLTRRTSWFRCNWLFFPPLSLPFKFFFFLNTLKLGKSVSQLDVKILPYRSTNQSNKPPPFNLLQFMENMMGDCLLLLGHFVHFLPPPRCTMRRWGEGEKKSLHSSRS